MNTQNYTASLKILTAVLCIGLYSCGPCYIPTETETDTSCCGSAPAEYSSASDPLRNHIVVPDLATPPGGWDLSSTKVCPCDTMLVEIDTSEWGESEEESAVARSTSKGEGSGGIYALPEINPFDSAKQANRT